MEDWKLDDPKLLEFDLNLCTPIELCEAFAVESYTANIIDEYRKETLHIFKFDQLLKLKGIHEETIQKWNRPKMNGDFDRNLQSALKIQTETPEPLPNLLDHICKLNGASLCLIAMQNSKIILQPYSNNPSFNPLVCKILEFIRPIQDSMFHTKQGVAEMQIIGFESADLIFLPTSGFYIVAMQPKGSLTPAIINLWRSLAAEIRRRYPPKIYINNHAQVHEGDIAFDCPKCNLRIVVDRVAAGYIFPCPRCKTKVTVPPETTSFSSFIPPRENKPNLS